MTISRKATERNLMAIFSLLPLANKFDGSPLSSKHFDDQKQQYSVVKAPPVHRWLIRHATVLCDSSFISLISIISLETGSYQG